MSGWHDFERMRDDIIVELRQARDALLDPAILDGGRTSPVEPPADISWLTMETVAGKYVPRHAATPRTAHWWFGWRR